RICSIGPPQRCVHPKPGRHDQRLTESGCVCHAVRAPRSNVTLAQATHAGSGAWNRGSIRTVPVNQSVGPLFDGCDPLLFISIFFLSTLDYQRSTSLFNSIFETSFRFFSFQHLTALTPQHLNSLLISIL